MDFYFDSWHALLTMDGHGPYVWAAYGLTLLVMGAMVIAPLRRKRRFMQEQQGRLRREERQRTEPSHKA